MRGQRSEEGSLRMGRIEPAVPPFYVGVGDTRRQKAAELLEGEGHLAPGRGRWG